MIILGEPNLAPKDPELDLMKIVTGWDLYKDLVLLSLRHLYYTFNDHFLANNNSLYKGYTALQKP
jgi:hypothetical protein